MNKEVVFVVLHANYGDQGTDFMGAFATEELAQAYIEKEEPNVDKQSYYIIEEVAVQDS